LFVLLRLLSFCLCPIGACVGCFGLLVPVPWHGWFVLFNSCVVWRVARATCLACLVWCRSSWGVYNCLTTPRQGWRGTYVGLGIPSRRGVPRSPSPWGASVLSLPTAGGWHMSGVGNDGTRRVPSRLFYTVPTLGSSSRHCLYFQRVTRMAGRCIVVLTWLGTL